MGTFGLERYDTKDFNEWITRSGFIDEYDFWSSLSGLGVGTTVDHMVSYLTSLGYVGSPHDQFRLFLEGQMGNIGSVYDIATKFYEGTWSPGAGDTFEFADGSNFNFADGDDFEFKDTI